MEASVSLKKVGKLLEGQSILAGLSFGIERGSVMAMVGPNDSGKSTLLKVLAGVIKPEFGKVFINGMDNQLRKNETRRVVGYMTQNPNFDFQLSIRENIVFHGLLYGLSTSLIHSQIRKLSDYFQIRDILDSYPANLSRGYLKRAMLVRTFIHDPEILFLDEPTSSLDLHSRYIVWDFLQRLKGEKTIVYATQSIDEAERLHDRITVIHHGRIVLEGTLDKLLETSGDLHHFQIQFEKLNDDMFKRLSKISTVVTPKQIGNTFDFYGRNRRVMFDVMKIAIEANLLDFKAKRVALETLIKASTEGELSDSD